MAVFLVIFSIAFIYMIFGSDFSFNSILQSTGVHEQAARPGYVLIYVALLQVFSYPAHDPVMMDRGFIANQNKTNYSFILAFLLSTFCIFGFIYRIKTLVPTFKCNCAICIEIIITL